MKAFLRALVLAGLVGFAVIARATDAPMLAWQPWGAAAFARARSEHKLVLLDLEAVWCHWCHVMDEITYRDPAVQRLLREHYVLIRVDQDSRPDLSNRYEDYGWPATVIFGADGAELVKRQGYVPPGPMARLLEACVADPTPGPSVRPETPEVATGSGALSDARRESLRAQWRDGYDDQAGGWGTSHKFLDGDTLELALRLAAGGDKRAETMARTTLRLGDRLLDPAWGGVYQYSVGGDWNEPHFEKIVPAQADNIRIYALAFARWGDPADRRHADEIHRYLRNFLTSPEGAVYTSQDADLVAGEHGDTYFALDDAHRRALGIPRVDQHVYARENGWVIAALAHLAAATGDDAAVAEAGNAAHWVVDHRALPGGGFRHDEKDAAGPFLGDTLAMGRAFLALHQVTQRPEWLARATAAADFIEAHFRRGDMPGYASSDTAVSAFPAPRPQFDENINLARFLAALSRETGRPERLEAARRALQWAASPEATSTRGFYVAGVLLADEEMRTEPLHVTIVGAKTDPTARAMFAEALRIPTAHKLVEWWDRREGPAPRGEDIFPESATAAAYLCANGACSSPLASAEQLHERLNRPRRN